MEKKKMFKVAALLGLAGLLAGCSFGGRYGNLWTTSKLTVQQLYEHWQDYDVYWAGASEGWPTAVMFDPKYDDKELVPQKYWSRATGKEQIAYLIAGMRGGPLGYPVLKEILGPDGRLFGYMYTPVVSVPLKLVGKNALWVDYISEYSRMPLDFPR